MNMNINFLKAFTKPPYHTRTYFKSRTQNQFKKFDFSGGGIYW